MKNLNREFFCNAGRKGGASKTDKKLKSALQNLKKARQKRWAKEVK
jgi:hypothetical protein